MAQRLRPKKTIFTVTSMTTSTIVVMTIPRKAMITAS
jgi:hypothetical protein